MEFYDAHRLSEVLPWPQLIDAIGNMLSEEDARSPARHVHRVSADGAPEDMSLLMPAWIPGKTLGLKVVNFFSSNTERGLPNIHAIYVMFDGETGEPRAVMDGEELGSRRTMAASALAARSLARPDASRLLVVGTGQLSPHAVAAHCHVRPITHVDIWGRNPQRAAAVVDRVSGLGLDAAVMAVTHLDQAVGQAHVISCVTSTDWPLVKGALLQPGTHLDLVGSFKPDMRESDDECVRRATVFVDTREGAMLSGDIAQPIESGLLSKDDIVADLRGLATGVHPGRTDPDEITFFKSAGFALEDLAAAQLAIASSQN